MTITYENAAGKITVGQAIELSNTGIAVEVNNGKDITFRILKKDLSAATEKAQ